MRYLYAVFQFCTDNKIITAQYMHKSADSFLKLPCYKTTQPKHVLSHFNNVEVSRQEFSLFLLKTWASHSSSELVPVHLEKQAAVTSSPLFVHLGKQDRISCSVPG